MTYSKKLFGVVAILLMFLTMSVGVVSAHDFRTGDNVSTTQDEVIDETLYAFGTTINITSEVNGDVICAGQTVNVSGVIHGDVICAGQTVNISGQVDGDVRLAGQTVTIGGQVDGNASIASQTFSLQSDGAIVGDISVGAEEISLNGPVGRDVAAASSNLVLASEVGRNVKATVEKIVLTSDANVAGNIEYTSKSTIVESSGSSVAGTVTRTEPKTKDTKGIAMFGASFAWIVYLFLALLFTAMAIALLFPSVLLSTTDRIMTTPWKALLIGVLASLTVPVVLIVLGITIIGLPLMILLGLIWLVIIILSGPFTGFYIGRLLLPTNKNTLLIMLAGSSVLLAFYFIPFVGFIAALGTYWLGTGMLLLELMRRTPKPSYAAISTPDSEVKAIVSKPKPKNTKTSKKTTTKKSSKSK